MRMHPSTSRATERATSHELIVLPTLTEAQFRELGGICGIEHPGRFKEWANDSDAHGGFRFEAAPEVFATACSYACGEGLRFRTETSITVAYEPLRTTGPEDTEVADALPADAETFSLDDTRLRAWLVDRCEDLDRTPDDDDVTFADLCSDEVNHTLDRCVAELVDAGILREPPGWSMGVYALDDLDQWGFLATVRVSNDAVRPGGVPFFQVADLGEDVRIDDSVRARLNELTAGANRLLPLARAAAVGTDPWATRHPDGMCKPHGDYDCGQDECRGEPPIPER